MNPPEDMDGSYAESSIALRESQGRYRTLFDMAPVAVYSCDATGVIREYNNRAAELWGRKPKSGDTDEKFCGSFKLYRPDGSYMPHPECPMGDVLSGKVPGIHNAEVHIERPDSSRVIVIVNIAPLKDDEGEITGAINCFYDVTHRKQAELQMHRLRDQLEERVAERTKELTESQSRLRALAAELNVTEQRARQRLATDLHDYLGQLLAVSKIKLSQARQMPLDSSLASIIADLEGATDSALNYTRTLISQLSPPDLADFGLPMALEWLTKQMEQHNLAVSLQINSTIPTLPGDQALLLFQSIRELLLNCVKHANVHEATVTLDIVNDALFVQVFDKGVGFDGGASSAKGATSPRGFGIFSIRERMLSLDGSFKIASAPGKGTTATLVLPVMNQARGHKSHHGEIAGNTIVEPATLVAASSSVRLLVVDDHEIVRQGLCSVLKEYGNIEVVGEASNGEEALALAGTLHPDVILMDASMPILDGVGATRRLKHEHPGVIVIGMSIHKTGVEAMMMEAGAKAFINKEVAVDELYRAICAVRQL